MQSPKLAFRRALVRFAGLVLAIAGVALGLNVALSSTGWVAVAQARSRKPDDVLAQLIEGNKRFAEGKLSNPRRTPKDFAAQAAGQKPLAVIVACADSRVAPELIFDQGVGDLFVVRIAGNVVSGAGPTVKGSIEYAVAELDVRLILVLGHSQCGAVKAAMEHLEAKDTLPGSIGELIKPIGPAVAAAKGQKGDMLANVIKANVLEGVRRLEGLDPIIAKLAKTGELKVIGGTYDLKTGEIEVFK
jgi:carbonic anhydrase